MWVATASVRVCSSKCYAKSFASIIYLNVMMTWKKIACVPIFQMKKLRLQKLHKLPKEKELMIGTARNQIFLIGSYALNLYTTLPPNLDTWMGGWMYSSFEVILWILGFVFAFFLVTPSQQASTCTYIYTDTHTSIPMYTHLHIHSYSGPILFNRSQISYYLNQNYMDSDSPNPPHMILF